MAGAAARSEQLDAIADNLANAQSPGYKAERPAFQSFLAKANGPTDKVFTAAVATAVDLRAGDAVVTDNPLDVLPDNDGFMAVRSGLGQIAYTRNGELKVGAGNQLVSDGHVLLGLDGQPIVVPPETVPKINPNGLVSANDVIIGQIPVFQLQGDVKRVGASLYAPGPTGSVTPVTNATFRIGEIEMGNATPLESAVAMIGAQRHFETAMQAIGIYKRMDDKAMDTGKVR